MIEKHYLKKTRQIAAFAVFLLLGTMTMNLNMSQVKALTGDEDGYEDNDYFGQAALINPTILNLTLGDEDWFKIYIEQFDYINITIEFDGLSCQMDLELYDDIQNLIAYSNSSQSELNSSENIVYNITYSNYYYIRIFTPSVYTNETYLMTISVGQYIYDDSYEQNDDFTTASELYLGRTENLSQYDNDYYKIWADQNRILFIFVDYDIFLENLSVILYDSSYSQLCNGIFNENTLVVEINHTTTYAGYYFLEITGLNNGLNYSINVSLNDAPLLDDQYEENDVMAQASEMLANDFYQDLALLDDDWYHFYFNFTLYCSMDIYVDFDGEISTDEVNIELYDENGYYLANFGAYNTSGNSYFELLDYSGTEIYQGFYIQISFTGQNPINYTLGIWDGSCYSCPNDDSFEENDMPEDATYLAPGYYEDLVLCDYDNDYYQLLPEVDENIQIILEWTDPTVSLILYIWFYNATEDTWDIDENVIISTSAEDMYYEIIYTVPNENPVIFNVEYDYGEFPYPESAADEETTSLISYSLNIIFLNQNDSDNTTTTTDNTSTDSNSDSSSTTTITNETSSYTETNSSISDLSPFAAVPGYPITIFISVMIISVIVAVVSKNKKVKIE